MDYVELFLSYNPRFESFKKVPLIPRTLSGSIISELYSNIQFLKRLLPLFKGIERIKHKNYVENKIDGLEQLIEKIEIEEIMRGGMWILKQDYLDVIVLVIIVLNLKEVCIIVH